MAAAGKKGKKSKWIPINYTDIIAEPTSLPAAQNWADSVDDTENYGYASRTRAPVVLPSASRAARGGLAVDEETIPRRPPYVAHISNLPYDVDESAITDLFEGLKITSLRLPRDADRLKGYGYVDFEDRESLINAMNMPDLTISGRRIRIEVATQDNDRRMGRGGRNDRDREYDPERTMGDWRSGPRAQPEPGRGGDRDRDRDRDRGRNPERDSAPRGDRDRERERDSSADNKPGGWRDGDRPAPPEPARTPYGGRDSFGRDRYDDRYGNRDRERGGYGRDGERSGYGGREGFRAAEREGGFGGRDRDRGFGGRGFGDRDRDPPPREESKPRERPKLNLLPRTVPRDPEAPSKPADGAPLEDKPQEKPAPKPVPAEKVFGAAKPVDTAAKEREIEERLRKQEEEARRAAEEKDRWGRKNDHSDDRRGGARRADDRPRDSRSYNRDRRDYSKDDKERRDYSKEDRRDYSRDRRDYSREDNRRADSPPRHDRSPDRSRRREPSEERPRNGAAEPRPSRSRDRREDAADAPPASVDERPLPKLREQEKPNFVGSNKFSFLEDADDGASD